VAVVIAVAAMEMVLPFILPLTPLVTLILSPALHLDTSPTMEILIFHWLEGKMPLAEEGVLVCCLLNYFMPYLLLRNSLFTLRLSESQGMFFKNSKAS